MRRGERMFGWAAVSVLAVGVLAVAARHRASARDVELRALLRQEAEIAGRMATACRAQDEAVDRWYAGGEVGRPLAVGPADEDLWAVGAGAAAAHRAPPGVTKSRENPDPARRAAPDGVEPAARNHAKACRATKGTIMADVMKWLRTATKVVFDPHRDRRVTEQAEQVWQHIKAERRAFDYDLTCRIIGVELQDIRVVAERVYQNALGRAWANGSLDATERKSLDIIGDLLRLDAGGRRKIEWEACAGVFKRAVADAAADGVVTADERDALATVAAGFGETTRGMMLAVFAGDSGGFLQHMFEQSLLKGSFSESDWRGLVASTAALGLTEAELRAAIQPQARTVVEQSLAQAKADGQVTEAERRGLYWLIATFGLPATAREYVDNVADDVNALAQIEAGRLPSVRVPGTFLQLRPGEIVHHAGYGTYAVTRRRAAGDHVEEHRGTVAITDSRLIFTAPTMALDLNHRRVLGINVGSNFADVQAGAKGTGCYYFESGRTEWAPVIYRVAIGRANQTIVDRAVGNPSRHVPRDVRQRVWQAYGGKCAECGATEYLEYDHIIPHARGGSSTEANVQLLCRRCNAKKSDNL
ncbi:MAG: hypothetical protein JWO31_2746 [Phycisphaerales bacterium]|nr:hypothetical protein [Phycisphaerales bacterium]